MSILNWFNKPKWQSPNEQVRITAIQNSQDNELINSLEEIINQDPSTKVQKAALSRLQNPQAWVRILAKHPDKTVKAQASKKLILWFTETSDAKQLIAFEQISDPNTIKTLAKNAHNPEVRTQALKQIKQQGLLSDLLFSEKDPKIQKLIIDKIDQSSTLERVLKKASKKDHAIKELVEIKLSNNNEVDQSKTAIDLCLQLEEVVHGRNESLNLHDVNEQWLEINTQLSAPLKLRYNGAFAAAKMILDPEHRTQFLKKQKQQRITSVLNEVEETISKHKNPSLQTVQATLGKVQEVDLNDAAPKDQQRHQNLLENLTQSRDQIQKQQKIPDEVTQTLDQMNQVLSHAIIQPNKLSMFKKQWDKNTKGIKQSETLGLLQDQFKQACIRMAEKIEQSAQLRNQAATDAVSMVDSTIIQIKEGHLAKAKEMTNQIAKLKKTAGFNHPIIKQNKYQLDSVWQQLKDLRNWQKWSNDKARQDIIDELHAMIGKAQHPDAVLKKLKDANERWYALEDMEKLPGDKYPSRNQKMWQDFRAVSKALFEPTQPFFAKRSEQQDSHLSQIQTSIDTMEHIDLDETSERDLARLSRDAIKHLKSLDKLPPKQRGKTAKKLRSAIDRIDTKLNEFYAAAENKKLDLIKQAQELSELEDTDTAIETAKNLQQQWKNAGIVKQYTERKLWKKFRQANDAVFNRRKNEKQKLDEEHKKQLLQANNLIKELSKKLKKIKGDSNLKAFKVEANQLWSDLAKPENMLNHEFNHLQLSINESIKKDQFKATLKSIKEKKKLDNFFSQLEQEKLSNEAFHEKTEGLLTAELKAFFSNRSKAKNDSGLLANLLIQAEFLTGLETPEPFLEARMAYQVKILSERMSGEKGLNDNQQALQWFDTWFLASKSDAQFMKSNSKRITAVFKALTDVVTQ